MSVEFRQSIAIEALNWLNVKYNHRGCSKRGVDCSGLPIGILKSLGFLKKFTMPEYPSDWNVHNPKINYLEMYLKDYCYVINANEACPGDLVVFRFGKKVSCSHIGILIEGNIVFIHCYQNTPVKYGTLHEGQWKKRFVGYYRINEERVRCL